jgi:hypothetical protein
LGIKERAEILERAMRDKDGEKKQGELKVRRRNWFIGRIYNAITNMLFQEDRVRRQMAEMFLYDR